MRKRSIQDDIIIANIYIYAPNIGVPIKQILTDLEGLIDNTIIVSTSISYFSAMVRSSTQKISREAFGT